MGDIFSDASDRPICAKHNHKFDPYFGCHDCKQERDKAIEDAKPWEQRYKELSRSTKHEIAHLKKTLENIRERIKKAHDDSFSGNW